MIRIPRSTHPAYFARAWAAEGLILTVIALAPLPFGSVERVWVAVWCGLLSLALALLPVPSVRLAQLLPAAPIVLLFGTMTVHIGVRATDFAPAAVTPPIWSRAGNLLQQPLIGHWDITAVSPWPAFGPSLLAFLAFLSAFAIGYERHRAWRAVVLLAAVGLAYAVFALGERAAGDAGTLFSDGSGARRPLTGPFVNRNHAVTFFGSAASVWLLLWFSELKGRLTAGPVTIGELGPTLVGEAPWKLIFPLLSFLICATATFLTVSRAGTILSVAVWVLAGGFFIYRWIYRYPRARWVFLSAVLLTAAGLEIWGGGLAYRIGMEGLSDALRRDAYRSTWATIREAPALGTGLGTFRDAFPSHRVEALPTHMVWDFAHSTPLEFAAELGLVQAALVLVAWGAVAFALGRGTFRRRRDMVLPLIGLSVGALGALHSCVDYPLQIPGYAVYWAALVGLGLAQSAGQSARTEAPPSNSFRSVNDTAPNGAVAQPTANVSVRADMGAALAKPHPPRRSILPQFVC
jgi:hypothetical protein